MTQFQIRLQQLRGRLDSGQIGEAELQHEIEMLRPFAGSDSEALANLQRYANGVFAARLGKKRG